jgi:putative transposase
MARKRYKPEEIVAKLRQVDVLVSQGQNMMDAIRQIGVKKPQGLNSPTVTSKPFILGN